MQGCKDTDLSLAVGAQGQIMWAKKAWTYTNYDVTHKNLISKTYQFLKIEPTRFSTFWEG